MGITKRGDGQIRAQVAHGARSVVSHIGDKQDSFSCWIQGLIERRRFNQVAIFFRRLKPSARLVTDQCEAAVMLAAPAFWINAAAWRQHGLTISQLM